MVQPTRERDDRFDGKFTAAWVKGTKPQDKEIQYSERLKRGLSLILWVSPQGAKTWRVQFYNQGKSKAKKIGTYPRMSLADAYEKAYEFDPEKANASDAAGTFKKVAEDWIIDHVEKRKLRTEYEIKRALKKYIYPRIGDRPIYDVTRLELNHMLRDIEKKHGSAQADNCLAVVRMICNWYAVEDHNYLSPIIKGMKRDKRPLSERSRNRILTDDEIRAVWAACGDDKLDKVFGALVRVLLLTGQRLGKTRTMRKGDLKDGVWTVREERREKGTIGKIKLPTMVVDLIEALPEIAGNDHVFPATVGKGEGPFNSCSQRKAELDKLLPDVPNWTLHDLRRTARSLMARIGIEDHIAEKVLGHRLTGVLAIYQRYAHDAEKADALQRLADHIALILNPPDKSNVIEMKKAPA